MRRLFIFLMILLLLWITSLLAQDGPLPVLENAHGLLEPFTPISLNGTFSGEPTLILVNGRVLEVPPQWSYTGEPIVGALPPFITRYDGPGYGFNFSWVNGMAGFAQDGIQLYGKQRYLIKIRYTTDLDYLSSDMPFVPSDMAFYGRIYTAQTGMIDLPRFTMDGLKATHDEEWVIKSPQNPYPFIRLEVGFAAEYPVFKGSVYLEWVEIQTAPADYKPDWVIPFG
jgi:hypothetical protein